MSTTVRQLFNQFDILDIGQVQWDKRISENGEGIYIISTSNNPNKHLGLTDNPEFNDEQIKIWINKLPDFKIDGLTANSTNLKKRLTEFWLPDESILYIGKAPKRNNEDGIGNRVKEYYATKIGNRGPHSGGQWIKVLQRLDSYTVYYGLCDNSTLIEYKMLEFFMSNVSKSTLSRLYDKELPLPFANIRINIDKRHDMTNQRIKKKKKTI